MYIIEQIFSHHGAEYVISVLSIFAFIIIWGMLKENKKY
jgi:hypothetical protein